MHGVSAIITGHSVKSRRGYADVATTKPDQLCRPHRYRSQTAMAYRPCSQGMLTKGFNFAFPRASQTEIAHMATNAGCYERPHSELHLAIAGRQSSRMTLRAGHCQRIALSHEHWRYWDGYWREVDSSVSWSHTGDLAALSLSAPSQVQCCPRLTRSCGRSCNDTS